MRAFKGALLKPGERDSVGKRVSEPRRLSTTVDKTKSRFDHLKQVVRSGLQTTFEVGAALLEIRDDRLYQHEFSTFEAFCESEFKIVRSRAYQLIEAAQIKDSLSAVAVAETITNERQARALAPVPEEKRVEVLEEVVAKGPVTAKAITEVAERVAAKAVKQETPKEAENEKHFDKTGYAIPDSILPDWQAAESFRSTLNDLQRIKLLVEKAIEKRELVYREVGQDTVADLKNTWTALKQVLPYAVCPTCQGRTRSKCSVCKQRGFVSEFGYTHWFAKEVIELRERAIRK